MLIADKSKLDSLELTQFERDNIKHFTASGGWVEKCIDRNGLKKRKQQTKRKMLMEEYIQLRPEYLKKERKKWRDLNILEIEDMDMNDEDGKETESLNKHLIINADESPFVLQVKERKQISKDGERVHIIAAPIVGDNKYRDGTIYI